MITNTEHIEIDTESAAQVNALRIRLLHDDRPVARFEEDQWMEE
jgi:hypothetical protein